MRSMLFIPVIPALLLAGCTLTESSLPLQPDSNWQVATLPNGMKYHLYPTDDSQVSLRLVINSGSFQETPQQQGYAHFIEHMAFNGSQHFAGNQVIELFEQAGGSFGADINAFTSYQQTTYKLDLADYKRLKDALTWMRDIGDGLEFDPNEVEKEKGVILGEWRRSRPEDKAFFYNLYNAMIDDTAYDQHDVLGSEASIQNATATALQNYYQRWYQPQYSELIVTGNVDAAQLSEVIQQTFSSWQSSTTEPLPKQRDIPLVVEDRVLLSNTLESPSVHYVIDRGAASEQSRAQQWQNWSDDISAKLIQQRLYATLNDSAEPFLDIYSTNEIINYSRVSFAGIFFAPEQRHEMNRLFTSTLASLRDHGVTQQELDTVLAEYHGWLDNLESDWSKHTPAYFADQRVFALEQNSVNQSKADYQQSLSQFVASYDLSQTNQQLRDLLSSDPAFIMGLDRGDKIAHWVGATKAVRAAYQQAGIKPLNMEVKSNGLLQPKQDGRILSVADHPGGFKVFQLSNGVEVWFQQDKQAGDRAYVNFASAGGKAALDPSLFAAFDVGTAAAIQSGLGQFSGSELDRFLRSKDVVLNPYLGLTHHGVEITAAKKHLAVAMQALYNTATEIKVEAKQLEAAKKNFVQNRESFINSPFGRWMMSIVSNFYQPQSRNQFLLPEDIKEVKAEQIYALHRELFHKNHGFKMVIVADLTSEQLTPLLRQYVASIELQDADPVDFSVKYRLDAKAYQSLNEGAESSSMHLVRLWNPQGEAKQGRAVFAEDMLQRISTSRVLKQLREEASLDYSPNVTSIALDNEAVSDWYFVSQLNPQDVEKMEAQLTTVLSQLANDITQQDVDTAAQQLSLALQDLDKDPKQRCWFYTRYLISGYGVDVLLDVDKTAHSITLQEIRRLAKHAFGPQAKRFTSVLNPKS
ncbi:M16 family metallopeptidase [Vibrio navarrensis]|uniref:M16 family metallopeptidase n=1 Tax=Vibrio navarrensis TaxID=29495 RepID=UPI0018DCF888|nr:M16 family metallopeptidase [Vibrio navarrensis]MBH9738369.1 peptidase M16 [Vibrio navarrensis]